MKPKNTNPPPTEDDHLFDMLVDGQLEGPRRRELLADLDDRPGGWRRCALAFLEAQSWREAMDALAHPRASAKAATEPSATQAAPPIRRRRRDYITTLLGMAASFLLGIGLYSLMYDMQRGGGPIGGGPGMAQIAGTDFAPGGRNEPPLKTVPVHQAPGLGQDVQLVGLSGNGPNGQRHTVRLPAVRRDRLDEDWLRNLPSAIPEDITRSLQQAGHDVRGSRRLLPFRLKDGRRLVVPVDQLDVRYISNPGYQ